MSFSGQFGIPGLTRLHWMSCFIVIFFLSYVLKQTPSTSVVQENVTILFCCEVKNCFMDYKTFLKFPSA